MGATKGETMDKQINEFWAYMDKAVCRTYVGFETHVLQFRNSEGLLTTEKWEFHPLRHCWHRVSIR